MFKIIRNILGFLLGRRLFWRLGRSLYMQARFDSPDKLNEAEEAMQRRFMTALNKKYEKLVIFDVGANIGKWSHLILQEALKLNVGDRLEIHAFEPIRSTFEMLEKRIHKHSLGHVVHLVPKAASCDEGPAKMFMVGEGAGTNSFYNFSGGANQDPVLINKTTIDLYCAENKIDVIHYLKCDAEGHDMEVLNGARKLFEEKRILACQFEYNSRWVYSRRFLKDVFDFIKELPYRVSKITPGGLEIYDAWHPELERFMEGNYVLLSEDAAHLFEARKGAFDRSNTYYTEQTKLK